jgi:hypothetical protein
MKNPFEPGSPQHQMPQFRIEDLDFAKLNRIIKWILLVVILMILWGGCPGAALFTRTGCGSAASDTSQFCSGW